MVETTILGVSGLRGGVGTTSITALLVDALSHMDSTVLVVVLNDLDLLRLHFNGAYTARQGWGRLFPKEPFGSDISFDWQEHYRKHLVPDLSRHSLGE